MGGVDYGKKVIDGVIQYESPSGLTMADPSQDGGCYRKWALAYIWGIREPFTGSQELGVQTHDEIDHHFKTGEMTLGRLAMSARHFIPDPDPRYTSELQLQDTVHDEDGKFLGWPGPPVLALEGVRTVGHIDLYRPWHSPENLFPPGYSDYLDHDGVLTRDPDYTVEVKDWKTSSDIGKWAKQGPALIKTVQMPLYAKYATVRDPEAQHVRISHVYMQTIGSARAHKSSALLNLREIDDRWEQMGAVMRTLKDVAKATKPGDVPANLHACGAFRGCMHAGTNNCPMTETQTLAQIFGITQSEKIEGKETMSLIDDINNLKAQDAAAATTAPAAPPVQDPEVADFAADWAIIVAADKGTPPLHQDAVPLYGKMTGNEFSKGAGIAGAGTLGTLRALNREDIKTLANNLRGVTAPVAPVAPLPAAAAPLPANVPAPAPAVEVPQAPAAAPVVVAPEAPAPAVVVKATPPAAGGVDEAVTKALACLAKGSFSTMRKDEMGTAIGALAQAYDAGAAAAGVDSAIEDASMGAYAKGFADGEASVPAYEGAGPAAAGTGFKLFINAVPSCPSDRLDDYTRQACAMLESQTGAKDIRCSDHDQLAFGKWKGALAACVRAMPLDDGCYVIETDNDIQAVVASTLCEAASVWIKGIKS